MGSRRTPIAVALAITAATILGAWLTVSRDYWPGFVFLSLSAGALLFFGRSRVASLGIPTILALAAIARLGVFAVPPTLSDDAYRFVWDAHLSEEGVNVYRYVPADSALSHIDRPQIREQLNSADYYSVYPPVSQIAFRAATALTGTGWPGGYYGVKGILVLAELIALLLLARICSASNFALYALNPLVIVEVAGQAHTEALMMPFLVGVIFLSRRRRARSRPRPNVATGFAAGALAAGATMVKLYPALWLPSLARRLGVGAIAGFAVAGTVFVLPFYAPGVLENVRSSLDLYVRLFEFNAGPYYLLKGAMKLSTGADWSKQIGPMLQWCFVSGAAVLITLDVGRLFRRLPLERILFWLLAGFIVSATTVHPWYFVPLVGLFVIDGSRSPAWLWLAGASSATYLFYSHGVYWEFVWLTWVGWLVILAWPAAEAVGTSYMRRRARRKAGVVLPFIGHTSDTTVLDLGCGEGYVGEAIYDVARCDVSLMDVVDYTDTQLPFLQITGETVPLDDNSFDHVLLYYVLHHAEDPQRLVREALRVCRKNVLIVESTYRSKAGRSVLLVLDRLANQLRSGGAMSHQPVTLQEPDAWGNIVQQEGGTVATRREFGHFPHVQLLLVATPDS